jgi:hypothetical protein
MDASVPKRGHDCFQLPGRGFDAQQRSLFHLDNQLPRSNMHKKSSSYILNYSTILSIVFQHFATSLSSSATTTGPKRIDDRHEASRKVSAEVLHREGEHKKWNHKRRTTQRFDSNQGAVQDCSAMMVNNRPRRSGQHLEEPTVRERPLLSQF